MAVFRLKSKISQKFDTVGVLKIPEIPCFEQSYLYQVRPPFLA